MVVPFKKTEKIHVRYDKLSPKPIMYQLEHGEDKNHFDGQQYATFIKSMSNFHPARDGRLSNKTKGYPKTKPSSNSPPLTDHSTRLANVKVARLNSAPPNIHNSLQTISQIKMKNEDEHRRKMKVIEDYMFQCKQEERELKRMESDVIKNERNLKKMLKDYESEVYNKQRNDDAILNSAMADEERIKQQHYLSEEKTTKDRMHRNINMVQKEKENESKAVNNLNELEFRYECIAEAIELKRIEVESLMKSFESKVKQKEEEEFRLKKEFADITMAIKMEALKKKRQSNYDEGYREKIEHKDKNDQLKKAELFREQIREHRGKTNNAERSRRRFSQDLQAKTAHVSMQEREDGRRLMDIRAKLQMNAKNQKEAQIKSELLQMERQGNISNERLMAVNARRQIIQDNIVRQHKLKNDAAMNAWLERNAIVNHETKRLSVEDNIDHFKKIVEKQDKNEYQLYTQVRQLQSEKRKQEQLVATLRQELLNTQKENKELLRKTAFDCQQQEKVLEERLQRETAQLKKALSEREERIQTLVRCRNGAKQDKHMLKEEQKVYNRLTRIGKKSDMIRSLEQ